MEFERAEIVPHLRDAGSELSIAAADEIERLRKKVADMQSDFRRIADCAQQQCPQDASVKF